MFVRLAALFFAVWFSAQTVLPGGAVRVCRYTRQRVAPCACRESRSPEDPRLVRQDCCEFRQGSHPEIQGVLPVLDSRPSLLALEAPLSPFAPPLAPTGRAETRVRAGHDPPPRERLFLRLRQWLL